MARNIILVLLMASLSLLNAHPLEEQERNAIQERKIGIVASNSFKAAANSDDLKFGIPQVAGNLAKVNFNAPTDEVVKNVADSVLPLITTGLNLIPGVGPIISGIVSGAWSYLSSLFGGSSTTQISPMERMINDLQDQLDKIKQQMKKLPDLIKKQRENRLKEIVGKVINGQIKRNTYICDKYADVSVTFIDEIKHNRTVDRQANTEMIAYIQDCDDFLKDTVEGFVYPEYADALWVPSLIMTLMRVAFLTEVSNYGFALHMEPKIISGFLFELEDSILRQYTLYGQAAKLRMETFIPDKRTNFTSKEVESCRMQTQLIYMDRRMYPFGVPETFVLTTARSSTTIRMKDFNLTGTDNPKHIQVLVNENPPSHAALHENLPGVYLVNCFLRGPMFLFNSEISRISFYVDFVPDKSYEIRVIYFDIQTYLRRNYDNTDTWDENIAMYNTRSVALNQQSETLYVINVERGQLNKDNFARFTFDITMPQALCGLPNSYDEVKNPKDLNKNKKPNEMWDCVPAQAVFDGTLVIETVGAVNAYPGDPIKLEIRNPDSYVFGKDQTIVFGVEFVVFPDMIEK